VLWTLIGVAVIAAVLTGYGLAAGRHRHWVASSVLFVAVALTITLIVELDEPRGGLIRVPADTLRSSSRRNFERACPGRLGIAARATMTAARQSLRLSRIGGTLARYGKIGRRVMRKLVIRTLLALTLTTPLAMPSPSLARPHDYRWQGDRNSGWDPSAHYHAGRYRERRLGRNDRIYRGRDNRYYCRRSDGSTGLVIGALAGGLLGNAIGGDTLSTLLGAGGGAALGSSIDRGQVRCR
jgi:hypothetical protein